MPFLTDQAIDVLESRYFDRDMETGECIENWQGLSRRVAHEAAQVENFYGHTPAQEAEDLFFDAVYNMDFLPNTPALMNLGSLGGLKLYSACFVQVPDDSIDSIMQHAWHSAKLFQAGAGVGYNFSNLRAEGEMVNSSMRPSSGSVSFMKHIFNSIGDVVKQGGRRRAAMMGLLNDNHPEIENFIAFKNQEDSLINFNISIFASDAFMRAIENDDWWELRYVKDGSVAKRVRAKTLFKQMINNNHKMAEPGMIWGDTINRHNPILLNKGPINCVNPCGEATLYNYENCCLGSINLYNHLKRVSANKVEWDYDKLTRTIFTAVRFLDNLVDANVHVSPEFRAASLETRRIGLGVTGLADCLIEMDSVYGSDSSFDISDDVASFINKVATEASSLLAKEKGPYPLWYGSEHEAMGLPLRNVSLLAIAPEGSRSIISNTSPSIEPNFGRVVTRTSKGIGSGTFAHKLAHKSAFVTTYEVPLDRHIKMQATWQNAFNKNKVAQSISKTNNAPANITPDELGEAYLEAWRSGCKGLTTYVDGSRDAVFYEKREDESRDEHGRIIQDCTTGTCDVGFEKAPAVSVDANVQ